jgi:hypothetical protein
VIFSWNVVVEDCLVKTETETPFEMSADMADGPMLPEAPTIVTFLSEKTFWTCEFHKV